MPGVAESRMAVASRRACVALMVVATLVAPVRAARAHVVRIEIVSRQSPAFGGARFGAVGQYEKIVGRVYGELDPADRRNAVINDIALAPRNVRGMVEYVATFTLLRPLDASKGNGVLLHDMVNRGNKLLLATFDYACAAASASAPCDVESAGDGFLFRLGYTILWSGWQGDLVPVDGRTDRNVLETVRVPTARNADGSPITGPVLVRWSNLAAGTTTLTLAQARISASALGASLPSTLSTTDARLETRAAESPTGEVTGVKAIPSSEWAWGDCTRAPFPGAPDSTRICLRAGADPALLYQLVYTARNPQVLMIGLAAFRDVGAFFRYESRDSQGNSNPIAGSIRKAILMGQPQSGNSQKTLIHYGLNESDAGTRGRIVWDGANPHIAARQNPINFRFARPGGSASLYEPGSEAVVWWERYRDTLRGRPPAGILDRCRATNTCPKIFETLGSAEFWGLRESPDFVGTSGVDIPLPANVRRYYFAGTTHGGGSGAFTLNPPKSRAVCVLPDDPAPEVEHERALLVALTDWVVRGIAPPPSRYPRMSERTLATPEDVARRFPRIPGAPSPAEMLNPLLEYDFGAAFDAGDMKGAITVQPPIVKRVLPSWVPQVDGDGNEIGGIKSVLVQNPLGTYTGWNVAASGFTKGQSCGFSGGFIPFAATRAERTASGDPRPSLEERYGSRDGYLRRVRASARRLVRERLLLEEDAARIVSKAEQSDAFSRLP
jgi:hypothetical protein